MDEYRLAIRSTVRVKTYIRAAKISNRLVIDIAVTVNTPHLRMYCAMTLSSPIHYGNYQLETIIRVGMMSWWLEYIPYIPPYRHKCEITTLS